MHFTHALAHSYARKKRGGVTVRLQEKERGGPITPVWIIRQLKRPSERSGHEWRREQVSGQRPSCTYLKSGSGETAFNHVCAVRSCLAALALDFPVLPLALSPERGFANSSLTFFNPRMEKMKRDGDERLGVMRERCTFPEVRIRLRWEGSLFTVKKSQMNSFYFLFYFVFFF